MKLIRIIAIRGIITNMIITIAIIAITKQSNMAYQNTTYPKCSELPVVLSQCYAVDNIYYISTTKISFTT